MSKKKYDKPISSTQKKKFVGVMAQGWRFLMKENVKMKNNPSISVAREDNMRGNSIEIGCIEKKTLMDTVTAQETKESFILLICIVFKFYRT